MAVVLFYFVFVVFFHRAPEQSSRPAPGIEKDSILEALIAGSHHERVVFARSVRIGLAPMQHQRLELEFLQTRAEVLRPVTAPAALALANVDRDHRELAIQSDAICFCAAVRLTVRGV